MKIELRITSWFLNKRTKPNNNTGRRTDTDDPKPALVAFLSGRTSSSSTRKSSYFSLSERRTLSSHFLHSVEVPVPRRLLRSILLSELSSFFRLSYFSIKTNHPKCAFCFIYSLKWILESDFNYLPSYQYHSSVLRGFLKV